MKVLWVLTTFVTCVFTKDNNTSYVSQSGKKSISPKLFYNQCEDRRTVITSYVQVDSWRNTWYNPCYERVTLYMAPLDRALRIQCSFFTCRYSTSIIEVYDWESSSYTYIRPASDVVVTTKGFRMTVRRRGLFSPCRATCTITAVSKTNPQCSCGERQVINPRIAGGSQAYDREFPWQVFVYTRTSARRYCSGAVVSYNWILTAASCRPEQGVTQLWIGSTNPYDNTKFVEYRSAQRVVLHYNFDGSNRDDIALIKMNRHVEFDENIQPICLPFNIPSYYTIVYTAGWGTTVNNGDYGSPELQRTRLYVISNDICRQQVSTSFIISSSQICAEMYRAGACEGDSGTSLVYEYNGRFYSIGVFSIASNNCANVPSVFTRVTSYLSWIDGTVDDTLCRPRT